MTTPYSASILRELVVLLGFNIDGHNLSNIEYENDTMLIAAIAKKSYRSFPPPIKIVDAQLLENASLSLLGLTLVQE